MTALALSFMVIAAGCGGDSVPVEKLADKLGKLKANTADTPYTVKLDNTVNISAKGSDINAAVESEGKYVILDLSECSATDNTLPKMSIIKDNTFLTGIVLPKSLTTIGEGAFAECQYLTSITIPASVTSIGGETPVGAFVGCGKLTSITVGAANPAFSSVDGVLFDKEKTTLILFPQGKSGTYTIPSTVTSIGAGAFYGCSGLTGVTIPDSVTSIGGGAFANNQLTSVTIGNSVTSIGAVAFANNQLTSVIIGNSVTSIGAVAFQNNQLTSVSIPDSVTSIDAGAFYGNQLNSVSIPDSVTAIGGGAFNGNPLTSVTIGGGILVEGPFTTNISGWPTFDSRFPTFDSKFTVVYNRGGKQAGTYVKTGDTWVKQ
jgi:hypothetical protein